LRRLRRICVFSLTRAAKKHLVSEKPPIQRFFKGAGVVLAGIECSPKIFDFRANGIPVQERVDFFDTLKKISGLKAGYSFDWELILLQRCRSRCRGR